MMDEVADAIDDIKTIARAKELVKRSQSAGKKMRRYRRFAENHELDRRAVPAAADLQTLAGPPKALAAKMQELIDSPGIRMRG